MSITAPSNVFLASRIDIFIPGPSTPPFKFNLQGVEYDVREVPRLRTVGWHSMSDVHMSNPSQWFTPQSPTPLLRTTAKAMNFANIYSSASPMRPRKLTSPLDDLKKALARCINEGVSFKTIDETYNYFSVKTIMDQ